MEEININEQETQDEKDKEIDKKLKQRIIIAIMVVILSLVTLYFFVIRDYYNPNSEEDNAPPPGESQIIQGVIRKGLVLEGGGAKGSYHIGAIKALSENGYEFDGVTGTSVGAINAALVAQGDIDLCYELWSTALPSTILDVDDDEIENLLSLNINIKTVKYFFKLIGKTLKNGGVSVKRVEQMIEKYIDEDKIRKSKMDFGIVTVSWSDRLQPLELFKEEIPADMMRDYILASAYYPAFQGKKINGKRYLDGGFYDNLPINPLIKRGYKEIIAIRTKRNNINVRKVIDNTVKIDYIQPMESLGGTLVFNNEKMLKNINLGYHDALRYIHTYLCEYYYV